MAFKKLLSKPLPRDQAERLIQRQVKRVLAACEPKVIILFGSAARNELRDNSDLDLLVVLPDYADPNKASMEFYTKPTQEDTVAVDALFFRESEFIVRSRMGGVCMVAASEGRQVYPVSEGQT